MFTDREIKRVERIGCEAHRLVMEGEFRAAKRLLKKIAHTYCVQESARITSIVEARILQLKGDPAAAKALILRDIGRLWGIPDGLEILAASNPKTNQDSRFHSIEILGGGVRLGAFLCFPQDYVGAFDVVANSLEEALGYIQEVANFENPAAKVVLKHDEQELEPGGFLYRGVVKTYPFRPHEEARAH